MQRILTLVLAGFCIFTVVAAIMIKVMPSPLKESDFMVIGSVATLVALLVLFLVLVSTTMKSSNLFFRKRRK
jgi:ABC-type Fe3+-siderophore transport system permease subunit